MTIRSLRRRLQSLVSLRRAERELSDEMRFHLDREAEKLIAEGHEPTEARRRAAVAFGSVATMVDGCRSERRPRLFADFVADSRFAVRQMGHQPLTTVAMIVVLSIGLGFSTAVFVLVSSITSAPPPAVTRASDAVRVRGIDRRGASRTIGREFSYAEVMEHTKQTAIFRQIGAWVSSDVVLGVGTEAADLQSGAATFVTPDYFAVLGVTPAIGPGLSAGSPAEAATAGVISDVVWTRFYDRSREVIGRTMRVNGTNVTIVGVMPPRFVGARTGGSAIRVWLPLRARSTVQPTAPPLTSTAAVYGVVARLAPGVGLDQATAVVDTIAMQVGAHPASSAFRPQAADVTPLLATNYFPPSGESGEPSSGIGRIIGPLMALLPLLITGTSVSALLAGRSLARRREMAVRVALGASRRRIVRQLLTETALTALLGAGLGLTALWWILSVVEATVLEAPLVITWEAGAFVAGLAVLASLLVGLAPALHATRTAAADILKTGGQTRSRTRLQAGLVVAQIAFTQPVLLSMGALLLELRSDLGRGPTVGAAEEIVEVRFNTNPRYGALDDARERAIGRVRDRVATLPGVVHVVPQDLYGDSARVSSHPTDALAGYGDGVTEPTSMTLVADRYFDAMGMPIEVGRAFTPGETLSGRTAMIDAGLARRLWPGVTAVGRRIVLDDARGVGHTGEFTVVGVVAAREHPEIFLPGSGAVTGHLIVRTAGHAENLLPSIRAVALEVAPEAPIVSARTLAAVQNEIRRSTMQGVAMAVVAGLIALLLAAVGLYAVVSEAVEQRRREIGIRSAMGAGPSTTVGLFLRRGVALSVVGATIGVALSIAATRMMAVADGREPPSGLFALGAVVTAFVLVVALVATWIPARRAARVDPLTVLRAE